ncbi:MAG: M14 family metallopeptidase [Thermincola sp.]|nr:M14 family metallopeptidase [Thermincola sp.]MDT3704791.1 M14 family metallopeptidase [Thermincola sp.]
METLVIGSTGPNVKLIQSLLNKLGYNAGPVDGYFGSQTQSAVITFQRDNGLVSDGIACPATWSVFERLLLGYDTYTIRPGDTLYNIARRYYTTLNAILTANPGINPNNLAVRQQITVPYGIDIVFTDIDYTFDILERQIMGLKARYPFIETGTFGQSVLGKNLYFIKLGSGSRQVFYNAAHHANEWITTPLLMKFVENFAKAYSVGGSIRGYSILDIWNQSTIFLAPMVNPDGVDLVSYWPNFPNTASMEAARLNNTGIPLPQVWKANIQGTDLNVNYSADWQREHELEIQLGITGPAPRDYGGPYPLSAPESAAMVNFTNQHNFSLTISYHTQGEVIYYSYQNLEPPETLRIAQLFSQVSGYAISQNPSEAAFAGYKDWFIQNFRRPGFTIEVGRGTNPLPVSQFPLIYRQNEEILLLGALL